MRLCVFHEIVKCFWEHFGNDSVCFECCTFFLICFAALICDLSLIDLLIKMSFNMTVAHLTS